ncbi:Hcp family type VI secretion system effector [Salmonella enterica subsp. enterica serovar Offa]|nr:Hcp family type VI secretion system effector [Salmonella enterica subsp. enterica serovar Offa]
MAHPIYLTLTGKIQGLISAGCSSVDSIGNRYQAGHEDEILVLNLNTGASRAQNASYKELTFTKPMDKAFPLLYSCVDNNEILEATFKCYRTSQHGQLEVYATYKLTGASLVSVDDVNANLVSDGSEDPYQIVRMRYQSISREHLKASTSTYSINSELI